MPVFCSITILHTYPQFSCLKPVYTRDKLFFFIYTVVTLFRQWLRSTYLDMYEGATVDGERNVAIPRRRASCPSREAGSNHPRGRRETTANRC